MLCTIIDSTRYSFWVGVFHSLQLKISKKGRIIPFTSRDFPILYFLFLCYIQNVYMTNWTWNSTIFILEHCYKLIWIPKQIRPVLISYYYNSLASIPYNSASNSATVSPNCWLANSEVRTCWRTKSRKVKIFPRSKPRSSPCSIPSARPRSKPFSSACSKA